MAEFSEAKQIEMFRMQADLIRDLTCRLAVEQAVTTGIVAFLANREILGDKFIKGLRAATPEVAQIFADFLPAIMKERLDGLEDTVAKFRPGGEGTE